jgi:hypothetical protein
MEGRENLPFSGNPRGLFGISVWIVVYDPILGQGTADFEFSAMTA